MMRNYHIGVKACVPSHHNGREGGGHWMQIDAGTWNLKNYVFITNIIYLNYILVFKTSVLPKQQK